MALRNLLERKLVSCSPKTPVTEVARLMDQENVGAVLVLEEDGRPAGIVTDRDIVLRCVVREADCSQKSVEDVMTDSLATVKLDEDIYNVIQVMRDHEVRRVPVVDDDGRAIGLLSFGDIFHLLGQEIRDLSATIAPERAKIVSRAA
jgi:CBS domain-containing protein